MPQFGAALPIPGRDPQILELAHVVAATVPAQAANDVIKRACSVAPLKQLKHVKRVRKRADGTKQLEIILCSLPEGGDGGADGGGGGGGGGHSADMEHSSSSARPAPEAATPQPVSPQMERPSPSSLGQLVPPGILAVVRDHALTMYVANVPSRPPETRAQWEEWCEVWPIAWKVPEASSTDAPPPLTDAEQAYFVANMTLALRLARDASVTSAAVIAEPPPACSGGGGKVGVMKASGVQPVPASAAAAAAAAASARAPAPNAPGSGGDAGGRVVATGGDAGGRVVATGGDAGGRVVATGVVQTGAHPLAHAVLLAIENAARRDRLGLGGGEIRVAAPERAAAQSHPTPGGGACHRSTLAQVAAAVMAGSGVQPQAGSATPAAEGCFAVATCADEGCNEGAGGSGATCEHGSRCATPPPELAAKRQRVASTSPPPPPSSPPARPYMCTGYDAFLVHEPCVMCAMALVHSRLSRVVYSECDTEHGALGGRCKLHSQRSLNHHFHVYRLPLLKEDSGEDTAAPSSRHTAL